MYFLKYSFYSLVIFFSGISLSIVDKADKKNNDPIYPKRTYVVTPYENAWVDSVYNSLSQEEKIAQTMMIRAHSDKGPDHIAAVENLIKKYNVGSLCFFQGTPQKQAELTNLYQSEAKTPLIIAIDAEWGLGMRLKESTISFPKNLALGAIQDNRLIYDLGKEIARECRRIGIHYNFAPAVDVNNNPQNPVINERSFGEDRYNVTAKGYQFMMGLQDGNVMACAKHFPGHGDTDVDSHQDLPSINHNRNRLDSLELFPFRVLIQHDIQSIMVAHLQVPSLDNTYNLPTTLSPKVITNLLKEELCYEGLIVTDALEMKGVTKHYKNGEIEVMALIAGNDILCLPNDVNASITEIKAALENGRLSWKRIEESVKKILHAKYRLGLNNYQPVNLQNIDSDLNTTSALALKRKLYEKSIVTVRNNDHIIPIKSNQKIATLAIGSQYITPFQKTIDNYQDVMHLVAPKQIDNELSVKLLDQLSGNDIVLVTLNDMTSKAAQNFNLNASITDFLQKLQSKQKVILSVFGNPYALKNFDFAQNVIIGWNTDEMVQSAVAQVICGAIGTNAKLPVTASSLAKFGDGVELTPNSLFSYDFPENVGMSSFKLQKVDSIVNDAIKQKAIPGSVVLVAKNGRIVYQKAFGRRTYDTTEAQIGTDAIYDLASITKMGATTLSVMKLYEEGKLDLDAPISNYLNELKGTDKATLTIREMMAHHAGLIPWIPFYKKTVTDSVKNGYPMNTYYQNASSANFSVPVAQNLFLRNDYTDSVWQKIIQSPLLKVKSYKYSDLGLIITGKIVERLTNMPLNQYVMTSFYQPMGLRSIGYKPLERISIDRIMPTEQDDYFRQQVIRGYVHDMASAMLGGVSGHAGLFSNANDLAVIMQLLLNKGEYNGVRYLKPETVKLFTTRFQGCSRRGIGFDMKELDTKAQQNMCVSASDLAFGHLGFTGTVTWADPKQDLVYVFLSNRTFPSMNNNKLIHMDTRIKIHQAIYDAIE